MADKTQYNVPTGTTTSGQQIYTSGVVDPSALNTVPAPATTTPSTTITNTVDAPTPTVATPPATTTTPPTTPTSTTPTSGTTTPLAMPANGSVVDLLNMAGQDSSQTARKALAQQFGVQGYDFSASKNQELAKKYLDFYNSKQGTQAPNTNPRQEISNAVSTTAQPDPQASFFDNYMTMNPVVKNLYDQINQQLSAPVTTQTFMDQYQQLVGQQGIPGLQTDLMNIQNIMDGTEDDIRTEIQKAGGFATESQIQALTGARNKTLMKQATSLTQQLQQKEDYVNQIMQFSQLDRAEVDKQVDRKLGLTEKLATLTDNINSAAKDNLNNIISKVGYAGLSTALAGDPQQTAQIESVLGLGAGGLAKLAAYTPPQTEEDKLKLQNMRLQNAKLQKDLSGAGAGGDNIQFISGTANQPAGYFNKTTQVFTPLEGNTAAGAQQLALAQDNISEVDNLIKSPGLAGLVGPNVLARNEFFNAYNGVSASFKASAAKLTNQLTLTNLQNAKANGATFGALSEGELQLLSNSSTKLNSWAHKDSNGNIEYFNVDEGTFKKELDKINNFAKLDYVLKGGDPTNVGLQQTADGKLWSQNSDGTYTEIK